MLAWRRGQFWGLCPLWVAWRKRWLIGSALRDPAHPCIPSQTSQSCYISDSARLTQDREGNCLGEHVILVVNPGVPHAKPNSASLTRLPPLILFLCHFADSGEEIDVSLPWSLMLHRLVLGLVFLSYNLLECRAVRGREDNQGFMSPIRL